MSATGRPNENASGQKKTPTRAQAKTKRKAHTPVMRQFFAAKAECPDAILFFRLGDFYEMFYDDAVRAAGLLDLTLTARGKGPDGEKIPMAGVPHHAAAGYIAKLLTAGERVAMCEQMADPSQVKGVVPREIVRVITPGICHDPASLDARANNYLSALASDASGVAIASFDVSTGDLEVSLVDSVSTLVSELLRLEPREVLVDKVAGENQWVELTYQELLQHLPNTVVRQQARQGTPAAWPKAASWLSNATSAEQAAVAGLLQYAAESTRGGPVTVHRASRNQRHAKLILDDSAVRNLELVRTLRGERSGSLLAHLDRTMTALGARGLRRRLLVPSQDLDQISAWADCVEELVTQETERRDARERLREVRDIERLAVRSELELAHPRDLAALRASLLAIAELAKMRTPCIARAFEHVDLCADLRERLVRELAEDPPHSTSSGGMICAGVSGTLDELRELATNGKALVAKLEARERVRTGIGSLKVKYTRVFGYYIEVTKSNLGSVPADYQRKQTIANGERYITEELAELQDKILSAQERAQKLESDLFADLRSAVGAAAVALHALAARVCELDVHAALAEVAVQHDYVRPEMTTKSVLALEQCRHPIVETLLPAGAFIANDIHLDAEGERFAMITGPNMAGKSTVMRQVALASVMAQMGGFVAARKARLGVLDRIHTRVGASDSLAHGQSTFMVEMTETATILAAATPRSLVIVDEIGRGTSTYDGLAIAWAVAEHLHNQTGCMTLFATHYHELCSLAAQCGKSLVNLHVAAQVEKERMLFVHELRRGSTSRSYGVEVARLAGLPERVVKRARSLLAELESRRHEEPSQGALFSDLDLEAHASDADEPTLLADRLRELESAIASLRLDATTPIEAWHQLQTLQHMVKAFD